MPDFSGRLFDRAPERGDVVVFRLPRDPATDLRQAPDRPARRPHPDARGTALHQRCAGAAPARPATYDGDTRYVETLPGRRATTRSSRSPTPSRHDDTPVFVVPARHYFMMGDNRDNSLDSRIAAADGGVGFVPEENLVARADRLLFSRDPSVGWLDVADWPHAFRLARLFGRIDWTSSQ